MCIRDRVYEKKLIDKDEYTKDVVVANITPGALPVEVAAGVGRKVCGIPGMLLSAVLSYSDFYHCFVSSSSSDYFLFNPC